MNMNDLVRYGIPPEIIQLWKERESSRLLPVQEAAVRQYDIFGDGNLLVQAPTSSGKTFVGEMAAVNAAMRRKRAIYLVPLKALAREKYRELRTKYADYGLKVVLSTRDHRTHDHDIETGDFSIAVMVYEKLASLLVRRPEHLQEIELVIADELEILSDPERGAVVELLMTRIVHSETRLIGLSAVVGEADRLAGWMRARLLAHERRPIELRVGVLHEGTFGYRSVNEGCTGEEEWHDSGDVPPWQALMDNVAALAATGESSLVFVKARHEARAGAEWLAENVELPAASSALEAIEVLEKTSTRESLLRTLASGVAFHSADLAPEERCAVEEAFRRGEVQVLVCTSTLAVGLNLPARNVFMSADKWNYDRRFPKPWKAPVLCSEFENMSGRAGRLGCGYEFGRAVLIAATAFERETLWRRYIEGVREPLRPQLDNDALADHVLRLVAMGICEDVEALVRFLENTPTGQWVWQDRYTIDEIEKRVRAAVHLAADSGFLCTTGAGRLNTTPVGRVAANKGIGIDTAMLLERWLREKETSVWTDLEALLVAACVPDAQLYSVGLTASEQAETDYSAVLRGQTMIYRAAGDTAAGGLAPEEIACAFEEARASKVALMLQDWSDHETIGSIEERYRCTVGQILGAADQIGWLLDAAAALAAVQGSPERMVNRVAALAERIQFGVRSEVLALARATDLELCRSDLIALERAGLISADSIRDVDARDLRSILSNADTVKRVQRWAVAHAEKKVVLGSAPALQIDETRPERILVDGVEIALQDKQFRLIQVLAEYAGECVPYDTIYDAVWGEVVVEPNQMSYQKSLLLDKIRAVRPDRGSLVRTIAKRGFLLDVRPDDVEVRLAACAAV